MEHIIQFGVSVDDDAILAMVSKKASDEVLKQVRDLANGNFYNGSKLERMAREEISKVVAENKDVIIDKAVKVVCDNIRNSKKYRDALVYCAEHMKGEEE